MTGLEIAILVGVVAFIVVGAISIGGKLLEQAEKDRRRQRFELIDISLRASRPKVLVGQNCDLRFYFTVDNPHSGQLSYDARVAVQEIADVPSQQNTFAHQHFRTEVPRLHCKWNSVGTKRVTGTVKVQGRWETLTGQAEGFVEVVAKLEDGD